MANRWGLNEVFGYNLSEDTVYHGSPTLITDHSMAAGTYFSPDIEVAKNYGAYIYSLDIPDRHEDLLKRDDLKEHLISRCAIPLCFFNLQSDLDK